MFSMTFSNTVGIYLKVVLNCRTVTVCLSTVLVQTGLSVATKCLRDEELGDSYKANVYYCEDEDKPECCEVDMSATCCEAKSEKTFREQFQLWGILGVAIVMIAFVVVCWRKDTYLCEGDTIKDRCKNSCRKRKKVPDEDSVELKVSKPKSLPEKKYNPETSHSTLGQREGTSVTARHIDPVFTSSHDIQVSDVDSGRGSVTSSASHNTRANEKMIETVDVSKSRSSDADIMVVQPTQDDKQGKEGEKKHSKKHKSKKKSKSNDKDIDSEDDDDEGGRSAKKDRSSKKRKKKSKHGSSHDEEETVMDINNV